MRFVLTLVFLSFSAATAAAEPIDYAALAKIRQEGFSNSKVMETVTALTEKIGPRLSNSPQMSAANAWTRDQLAAWGLSNARLESFGPFGRGWQYQSASVNMTAPRAFTLSALPKAWTPGTAGPVEGEAMLLVAKTREDLEKHKGQLKGKILFISDAREYKPADKPDFTRYDEDKLKELQTFTIPAPADVKKRAADAEAFLKQREFSTFSNRFMAEEGVLATVSLSSWDNGILRVMGGGSRKAGEPVGVPALVMITEHYNQILRLLEKKETVRLALDVRAQFTSDDDRMANNTLAELPGNSLKNEVVMIGAHLDSWHTGTGAADNAAGVAVMMEAMRILKASGLKPRRTIRIGLWSGEEQGLLGSAAYVGQHFAELPAPTDPKLKDLPRSLQENPLPPVYKADHKRISAYYNYDNGGGRIRGIYAQENLAAAEIFKQWIVPMADLGVTTVTNRNTGSTDHISFDRVGIPGFQFVQDNLDYFTHVHHTHLDGLDHLQAEDLRQSAVVVATLAYLTAMRDAPLPRKAQP
ncbi:M20/M25/M40 family metallo-hydrolase [Arenimonas sp. GDDSR-1]|uniref:M20/M25/M40 family metallo-hydrolase n=1 Tax=Arenimonas sp. GDDSR-1 TaxID=2950125 RepID=UPI002621ADE3|nr:M20/M25/M40 family metallo-hydrolase [Arenimonas sp. GDDSR-1]